MAICSFEDLENFVTLAAGIKDRGQLARFIQDSSKPSRWDKVMWYYKNALLSNMSNQALYAAVDTTRVFTETLLVTPTAAAIGKVRTAITKGEERVFLGEAGARLWGNISSVPDGFRAALHTIKTGETPRIKGLDPASDTMRWAADKSVTKTLGLPARTAAAIGEIFKTMGFRSELRAQAYRRAVIDGHKPGTAEFGRALEEYTQFPTEAAMDAAADYAATMTHLQELPDVYRSVHQALRKSKVGEVVVPFYTTPTNTFRAGAIEHTPWAFIDPKYREAITGKHGKAAQDMAHARMAVGAAFMGSAVYMATAGYITGGGPRDPQERKVWLMSHRPWSVRVGDEWIGYDRFYPIAGALAIGSTIAEIGGAWSEGEKQEAVNRAVASAFHVVGENLGLESIYEFFEAGFNPEKSLERFAGNKVAGALPFSSALGAIASSMDPHMRQTKTFLDNIKNKIPVVRETLPVARDWSGLARANPRYGNWFLPGTAVINDPVDIELDRLGIAKTAPQSSIKGVKLGREMNDFYQETAGTFTRDRLKALIAMPKYQERGAGAQERMVRQVITDSRSAAAAITMNRYPSIMDEAKRLKLGAWNRQEGQKKPKSVPLEP